MLETVFLILMSVFFVAFTAMQTLYFVHMLQLNSYRSERYDAWCHQNRKQLLAPKRWLGLLGLPFLFLPSATAIYGAAAGVFLLGTLCNIPKKAKKPLVVTARVKRLFATLWSLLVLIAAVCFWFGRFSAVAFTAMLCVFSVLPFGYTALANTINGPMENAIANGYVKDAARILSEMPQLTVIGITGSYGKTTTKNYLHALLSARYNVLMTPESYNTTMGVVRTIRERLKPSHQIFIAEMGAKNVGDIKEICDLVSPRYGMITAVGEQHLETFGTVEAIANTKFELVDALPQDGVAFLNADNAVIRERLASVTVPTVTYGTAEGQYVASDMHFDRQGCRFTVTAPNGEQCAFTTKLLGGHNIQNLTGCIAVAHTLGIPFKELVYPVRMLRPVPHRLQMLPNGYIDDAYNSNPAGFRSALDTLKQFEGQRVLVTPGMVELGEQQEALNCELGAHAAACCDYAVLVGLKQAPPLKEGLLSAGFPENRIFVAATLTEGLAFVNNLPHEGPRTVLLENDLPDNF